MSEQEESSNFINDLSFEQKRPISIKNTLNFSINDSSFLKSGDLSMIEPADENSFAQYQVGTLTDALQKGYNQPVQEKIKSVEETCASFMSELNGPAATNIAKVKHDLKMLTSFSEKESSDPMLTFFKG